MNTTNESEKFTAKNGELAAQIKNIVKFLNIVCQPSPYQSKLPKEDPSTEALAI